MKFRPTAIVRTIVVAAAAVTALALPAGASASAWSDNDSQWSGWKNRTYEVKITNLAGGQPLSPPTLATHYGRGVIFSRGHLPSVGLLNVAENGGSDVLAQELSFLKYYGWVHDITRADKPLVPKGRPAAAMFSDTMTLRITSRGWADRLSFASMLGCTNDGFTGVDGLKLPRYKGGSVTVQTHAYDAGTERNTESFADLGAACQGAIGVKSTAGVAGTSGGASNPDLFDLRRVGPHAGVRGDAADGLKADVHGWDGAVASITVTALN